jgi:hypothetical protein
MKNFISQTILFILKNVSRGVAIWAAFCSIILNLSHIKKTGAILLNPDSGFGHTISGPDWLRRLHPHVRTLTLFGTSFDPDRHNRLITELWGDDVFIWIRQGIMVSHFGAIYDPVLSGAIFRFLKRFLHWYVPNAPCYLSADDLVRATPQPKWLKAESQFNQRYESRYYPLIDAVPLPTLHVSQRIYSVTSKALRDRFGSSYPHRCTLYIRQRGSAVGNDLSSVSRTVPSLQDHMKAVSVLNEAGYQVLIAGDAVCSESRIAEYAGGLVDWRAAGVARDVFHLFAGAEVDVHIGCLSGGSTYSFVTDIPSLMINAFPPGDAYPKSTVYYKWLFDLNGHIASLNDLLAGKFFDHQLHNFQLINNNADEMADAVSDFIKHLNERPYGIDPARLGIDAPWIRAANGRLSPIWLRDYHQRANRHRKNEVAASL